MKRRILIVEDAPEIRMLLSRLLASQGYDIDCAANGQDALDQLRAAKNLPGLILLDLMMPEMDGYQFREEQEKDASLTHIPFVIMTAGGDIQSKATQIGACAFLKKPFSNVDSILNTVEQFFPKST